MGQPINTSVQLLKKDNQWLVRVLENGKKVPDRGPMSEEAARQLEREEKKRLGIGN